MVISTRDHIIHTRSDHQLNLRFYDLDVSIESDSADFVEMFSRLYPRFLTDGREASDHCINFQLYTRDDNPYGMPAIVYQGEVITMTDPTWLDGFLYENIYYTILNQIKSHLLFHAGTVSYNHRGVILAADSMRGKTTTVLELSRRGFDYLSDELAAIGRVDKMIHPFARSLRIRKDTLERVGYAEAAIHASSWAEKLLLDIEEIKPGSLGEAVPVSKIIIFSGSLEGSLVQPPHLEKERHIVLDQVNDDFLRRISEISEITGYKLTGCTNCAVLSIRATDIRSALLQIEESCREQDVIFFDVIKKFDSQPSFESPARLEPITHTQACVELMRRFMGGHKSLLLKEELRGSSKHLFLEILSLIDQAECYRLSIGPLNQMADLICELVEN